MRNLTGHQPCDSLLGSEHAAVPKVCCQCFCITTTLSIRILCYEVLLPLCEILRVDITDVFLEGVDHQFTLHAKVKFRIFSFHPGACSMRVARVVGTSHDKSQSGASDEGLAIVYRVPFRFIYGRIGLLKVLQKVAPTLHTLRRSHDPLLEFSLYGLLLSHHVKPLAALHLAAVQLLHVAEAEEVVRIFEAHIRILVHPSLDDGHLLAADAVADRVLEGLGEIHLVRRAVSVSPARVSYYHGVVTGLISVKGNLQLTQRFQRHIFR